MFGLRLICFLQENNLKVYVLFLKPCLHTILHFLYFVGYNLYRLLHITAFSCLVYLQNICKGFFFAFWDMCNIYNIKHCSWTDFNLNMEPILCANIPCPHKMGPGSSPRNHQFLHQHNSTSGFGGR